MDNSYFAAAAGHIIMGGFMNSVASIKKKLDEIAAVMGLNGNTVKSTLYRSLQKLKTELEKGEMPDE